MVPLCARSSSASRNMLTLSSKASFAVRFACARTSAIPTKQSASLLHAMPNGALMTTIMSKVGTLIEIAIAPTATSVERQSTLVASSTPAIVTGRITVATISLNS